jgi:hypothetical protein
MARLRRPNISGVDRMAAERPKKGDVTAMNERIHRRTRKGRRIVGLLALLVVAALGVVVLPSAADHGVPHVVPLAHGSFAQEDVAASIRVKIDNERTHVINVKDASDVVFVEITIHDGARVPWHTHAGPGLLVNRGPGTLTSIMGDDCVLRHYGPGEALVDLGQGTMHAAFNDSGQDLVVYAAFLGVDNGPVLPAESPANCDPFP